MFSKEYMFSVVILWNRYDFSDPNEYESDNPLLPVTKERNRYRAISWDEYEVAHQKYLEIGKDYFVYRLFKMTSFFYFTLPIFISKCGMIKDKIR